MIASRCSRIYGKHLQKALSFNVCRKCFTIKFARR
nr:MAG TPA: hypothetical protein [Caudoviricetes sp.]